MARCKLTWCCCDWCWFQNPGDQLYLFMAIRLLMLLAIRNDEARRYLQSEQESWSTWMTV